MKLCRLPNCQAATLREQLNQVLTYCQWSASTRVDRKKKCVFVQCFSSKFVHIVPGFFIAWELQAKVNVLDVMYPVNSRIWVPVLYWAPFWVLRSTLVVPIKSCIISQGSPVMRPLDLSVVCQHPRILKSLRQIGSNRPTKTWNDYLRESGINASPNELPQAVGCGSKFGPRFGQMY